MEVIKRTGEHVPFDFSKIENAVNKAFKEVYDSEAPADLIDYLRAASETFEKDQTVEDIQNFVEYALGEFKYYESDELVTKAFETVARLISNEEITSENFELNAIEEDGQIEE